MHLQSVPCSSAKNTPVNKLGCRMFPTAVAMNVFLWLEWVESLVVARASQSTRSVLEPALLLLSQSALRAVARDHGRPQVFVSEHFPAFNVVRLWRLTGGWLKKYLEHLARNARNRRYMCWFQVQEIDGPELWRPRGEEVPAGRQVTELARSPLHRVAGLVAGWNLQLFVGRYLCPTLGGPLLVEQWEVCGYLYGWRIFASLQKHSIVPTPETSPRADPDPLELAFRATATLLPSL